MKGNELQRRKALGTTGPRPCAEAKHDRLAQAGTEEALAPAFCGESSPSVLLVLYIFGLER